MNRIRWKSTLPLACLGLTLLALAPARAALNAYLTIKGQTQGAIQGSVTQKGRENKIAVIAFNHDLKTPVDAAPSFDVILAAVDAQQKTRVINVLRDVAALSLKDAQALVEATPRPVKEGVAMKEAEALKAILERAGATVEIKPGSGPSAGKRQHGLLTIRKELDKSTPLLYQALSSNETLTDWELQCWRPSATGVGTEQQHYTIKLTGARVVGIRQRMPNTRDAQLTRLETYEEVSFSYQTITWIWNDGGITATAARE
jgi:type VI secretion system Hcp family effector